MLKRTAILAARIFSNLLNPNKLPICRFEPSCTHYAAEAIDRHGVIGGVYLIFGRLIKCQPWGPHGFDPVPDPQSRSLRKA